MSARVRDVVRNVVGEVAPAELPLIESLSQVDDTTALRLLTRRRRRRDPLGFGLDEVVVLVSPVVWIVVNEAAKRAANSAIDSGAKAARSSVRRALGRRREAVTIPPLSPAQIADVEERVLELAVDSGLTTQRANVLAKSVAGQLFLQAQPRSAGEAGGKTD